MGPGAPQGPQTGPGALRDALVLLLLLGTTATGPAPGAHAQAPVHPGGPCRKGVAPLKNLSQPGYPDIPVVDTGSDFMSPLVQSFLNTVQPNGFPLDFIVTLATNTTIGLNSATLREILQYETGFLVCVAIGVVYIVLTPLVGFFLACCRCCGNCGGKMYQKQTSSIKCRRRFHYWSLFIITALLLAGNVCMFKSNEAIRVSVGKGDRTVAAVIDTMQTYITAVPQQISFVGNGSFKTVNEVTENLDDIGSQLGSRLQRRFRVPLNPALDSVVLLEQDANQTLVLMRELNRTVDLLRLSSDSVQANVSGVREEVNRTLQSPGCLGCTGSQLQAELQALSLDTTLEMPNLSGIQTAVDEVIDAKLQSVAFDYLSKIPQMVTNETMSVVLSTKQQLKDIEVQFSKLANNVSLAPLKDLSSTLDQAQTEINKINPYIQEGNYIKWAVGVAICCLVLLVVVCNFLGLLLGPAGLKAKADPRQRSGMASCGGTFLMMGAGFSVLFSWLFMILVLLSFVLGGHLFTLVCKPWYSGELLQLVDSLDFPLPDNVTAAGILRDCRTNMPIWSILHLSENKDLENALNVSKYTEDILKDFEGTDINLPHFPLLSDEVRTQLRDFPAKLSAVNFTAARVGLGNITSTNLNTTADQINNLGNLQQAPEIKTKLQDSATRLREIQMNMEMVVFPQVANLQSLINQLESHALKTNGTVSRVASELEAAQVFLNTNTTAIVKAESRGFLTCQMQLFDSYATWAKLMLMDELGRCGPVAGAVDSVATLLCSHVVESLNAFWFSLGWCMVFFIPSIILSIRLSKFYRKMKHADEEKKHIMMNPIPRATMY